MTAEELALAVVIHANQANEMPFNPDEEDMLRVLAQAIVKVMAIATELADPGLLAETLLGSLAAASHIGYEIHKREAAKQPLWMVHEADPGVLQ
jgi:hypothetical protein